MSTHTPYPLTRRFQHDKALILTILSVVTLGSLSLLWLKALNSTPTMVIPSPTLPSPNAFDSYVAAGNALVDVNKIGFALSTRHSMSHAAPQDHAYSLAEKDALVDENARPLRLLRQGFAYPYLNPPLRSFNTALPYYARFRNMARLLTLEGQTRQGHGDWGGAVNFNLDAVRLGEDIPRGGVMIGMLVGVACQAIGRQPVWGAVNHLTAAQAQDAARRMEDIRARHVPYADVLQEEKWSTEAGLLEVMRKPNWRRELAGVSGSGVNSVYFQLLFTSKGRILRNYTRFMDQSIANARRPYAAHAPAPAIPSDPVNQILLNVFDKARFRDVENETQNALLKTLLALRAYRLEQGAYPTTLSLLAPTYLTRVPDDPFALSGPLRYRQTGKSFVLYSVGPDGKDDSGKPIFDPSMSTSASMTAGGNPRRVEEGSIGDVVAGVNKI